MITFSFPLILGGLFGAFALGAFVMMALIHWLLKDAPEPHDHEL